MDIDQNSRNIGFPDTFDAYFFQKAWDIFWNYRAFIVKLVLLTAFIVTFLLEVLDKSIILQYDPGQLDLETVTPRDLLSYLFFIFLVQLIVLIPKAFLFVVFILTLPKMYESVTINFSDSLIAGFSKWIPLYMYSALVTLLTDLGLMVLIIPGILIAIQFTLLQFVVVLEENVKIIPRSFYIISGKQWKVLAIYLIKIFVLVVLSFPFLVSMFSGAFEPSSDFNSEGTVSNTQFLYSFIEQIIMAGVTYFITILFFQLYMMTRIENNEIEIVQDG